VESLTYEGHRKYTFETFSRLCCYSLIITRQLWPIFAIERLPSFEWPYVWAWRNAQWKHLQSTHEFSVVNVKKKRKAVRVVLLIAFSFRVERNSSGILRIHQNWASASHIRLQRRTWTCSMKREHQRRETADCEEVKNTTRIFFNFLNYLL